MCELRRQRNTKGSRKKTDRVRESRKIERQKAKSCDAEKERCTCLKKTECTKREKELKERQ